MAAMAPEDKGIKKRKVSDGEDLELSHGTAVESKLTNGILVLSFHLTYRCALCIFVISCLEGLYQTFTFWCR